MVKRVSFARESFGFHAILDHHVDLQSSLKNFYINARKNNTLDAKFVGYTEGEILDEYRLRSDELEKSTVFSMLSILEASFRVDYLNRSYNRLKDPLSKKLREVYKNKGKKASLEKDVLSAWKLHDLDNKQLISELISALKFRHWLAHGRYWEPKLGRKYDYSHVHNLSVLIYRNISFQIDYTSPVR